MTLPRLSLFALIASLSLVTQFASAQVSDAAGRIDELAAQLQMEFRTDYHDSRFEGALVGLSQTMENEAHDILRLANRGPGVGGAIAANSNNIRRLALRANELLNQVEVDIRLGRTHVHGSLVPARRMLVEIDRLAAAISQMVTPAPVFDRGLGLPCGNQVIYRHTTSYGGYGYGGSSYYDSRLVYPAVQPTIVTPRTGTGLWVGGSNWGIQIGR